MQEVYYVPPLWSEGERIIQPNAVQVNPDGRKFLVAVEEVQSPQSQVCVLKMLMI